MDQPQYAIALPPQLGIHPDDFVTAWNEDEQSCRAAQARLETSSTTSYNLWADATIAVLTTMATGIPTNALYDLLKEALIRSLHHKKLSISKEHIHIEQVEHPDGTKLLVIDIDRN